MNSFNFKNIYIPPAASFFAMILCCSIFYPGAMTWDSLEQLRQARSNEYGDWQPPAMAFLWAHLLVFSDGPGAMLLFHMSMLYAASTLLYLWSSKNNYKFSVLFVLIPYFPWIINFEFVIWKDVGLAYSWLLAIAMAVFISPKERPSIFPITVILLLFTYGFLVRSNSPSAALFSLPFIVACIFKKNSLKSFFIITLFTACFSILLPKIMSMITFSKTTHPTSYFMFDDVVALKLRGGVFDVPFLEKGDLLNLQSCENLLKNKVGAAFCIPEKFEIIQSKNYTTLRAVWLSAIAANFPEYIKYRLTAFITLIRSPTLKSYYPFEFRVINYPYVFDSAQQPESLGRKLLIRYVYISSKLADELFKPYFWMLASILISLALKKSKNHRNTPFWMLPLSGLSYAIGYIPVTPAGDLRYTYWLSLIVTTSFIIWISIAFKKNIEPTPGIGQLTP